MCSSSKFLALQETAFQVGWPSSFVHVKSLGLRFGPLTTVSLPPPILWTCYLAGVIIVLALCGVFLSRQGLTSPQSPRHVVDLHALYCLFSTTGSAALGRFMGSGI